MGTKVPGTLTKISPTQFTFTPTSDLLGTTEYKCVINSDFRSATGILIDEKTEILFKTDNTTYYHFTGGSPNDIVNIPVTDYISSGDAGATLRFETEYNLFTLADPGDYTTTLFQNQQITSDPWSISVHKYSSNMQFNLAENYGGGTYIVQRGIYILPITIDKNWHNLVVNMKIITPTANYQPCWEVTGTLDGVDFIASNYAIVNSISQMNGANGQMIGSTRPHGQRNTKITYISSIGVETILFDYLMNEEVPAGSAPFTDYTIDRNGTNHGTPDDISDKNDFFNNTP